MLKKERLNLLNIRSTRATAAWSGTSAGDGSCTCSELSSDADADFANVAVIDAAHTNLGKKLDGVCKEIAAEAAHVSERGKSLLHEQPNCSRDMRLPSHSLFSTAHCAA